MKLILVATDLSERSDRALERAFALAEQTGAALKLLHVTDGDLPEEIAKIHQHEALQRLTTLTAARPQIETRIEAAIDDPMSYIHTVAEAQDADLIVLGAHRRRPLTDMFFSTTMERLVRASRRPVLLVSQATAGAYRRPLCGIDLSPASAAAARMAAHLAPEAEIASFFAYHVPFHSMAGGELEQRLAPFLAEAKAELDAWTKTADLPERFQKPEPVMAGVRQALDRAMAVNKPDLLAVGAHGRSSLSLNLLGSFTQELLREPLCDTLVVRG